MSLKINFVSGEAAHGSTWSGAAADRLRQQEWQEQQRSCGDGSGLRLCCATARCDAVNGAFRARVQAVSMQPALLRC